MFSSNMPVRQAFRFFRGVSQDPLAFVAQRQIDRGRNLLANRGVAFNLLADRFYRGVRPQEAVGQGLIFAQKPKQQMLSLNIRRPELAGFVARKEDYASGFLRVTFKHMPIPLKLGPRRRLKPAGPIEILTHFSLASGSGYQFHYAIKPPPNPSTQTFM